MKGSALISLWSKADMVASRLFGGFACSISVEV
jgi:hypothetical protein